MARRFIACPTPDVSALANDVAHACAGRPASASSHVTLAFLGEQEVDYPALEGALADKVQLTATWQGLGAFSSVRHARVVWVGLQAPGLDDLAHDVQRAILGEPERRDFRPHVTLCRLRQPRDVRSAISHAQGPQGEFTLDRVVVYRSHLTATGATYEAERTWTLPAPV